MKKILVILLLATVSFGLKAQQLTIKPTDSLVFKSFPKSFKLNDSTLFKNFSKVPKGNLLAIMPVEPLNNKNFEIFYSRMPVVKLYGNDKMPMAKTANVDRMPIKTIIVIDPLLKLKQPAP